MALNQANFYIVVPIAITDDICSSRFINGIDNS